MGPWAMLIKPTSNAFSLPWSVFKTSLGSAIEQPKTVIPSRRRPTMKTQDFTSSCYEPTGHEWLKALEHWHARAQPFVLRKFILLLRGYVLLGTDDEHDGHKKTSTGAVRSRGWKMMTETNEDDDG
ncbi:hypothetical protein WN943_016896 [Citrus x changshan-huyou]